ncbi:TPA: MATE family efflux transporter, partial [Clostridioides difficile]
MKRSFFQYVSLNVLGALGLSGYILADTLFVAHRLGTDGLAALNLAISVFGLINGLGLMLGIGGATRYAICRTQGDGVRADRAFSRALACGGALGGLLALAG